MVTPITERFTDQVLFAEGLFPDARAVGVYNTEWVSMNDAQRLAAILRVGEMGAGATVDFHLEEAQSLVGGNAQAIAGKAITQIVQGVDADNDQRVIELRTPELTVSTAAGATGGGTGYDCVRGVLTIAGAAVECDVMLLRHTLNYPPPATVGVIDEVVP